MIFTEQEIQAVLNDTSRALALITKREAAREHVGEDARRARMRIWHAANDCLAELEGVEPENDDPQAELQAAMEAFGCDSVWYPITKLQTEAKLAQGHRAFLRNGGAA